MNTETYQGWTNYTTWAVALWMQNDQGTHEHCWRTLPAAAVAQVAQETEESAEVNGTADAFADEQPRWLLADMLKDHVEMIVDEATGEGLPEPLPTLLQAALTEVDWNDIAESAMESYKEELSYAKS